MRRTPLKRGKPLRARPKEPPSRDEREAMRAFKDAVRGRVCVVCAKSGREAHQLTGMGHESHHGVRRQVLRRLGLPEWDPRLAVCVCTEPCHRRHTSRHRRILRAELPPALLEFVAEHGLQLELEREYPE